MKKGLKIIIIIIVILLILILGIIAGLYFLTDIFKSDKELFFKYMVQNKELIEIFQDEDIKIYKEKQNNLPYTENSTLTSTDGSNDSTNGSISCVGNVDKLNNYTYKNIKLNYSQTDAISFHYLNMQDYYGLKIDDVMTNYIAIENNNLKEFLTKMGVDETVVQKVPDKIDFDNFNLKIFTDEEIAELKTKYSTILLNNLTDTIFSKSETETSKIYTITLTQSEYQSILNKLLEEIKNDSVIINSIKQFIMKNSDCTESDVSEYISQIKIKIQEIQDDIISGSNSSAHTLTINLYTENKILTKTEFLESNGSKFTILKTDNGYKIETLEEWQTTSNYIQIDKIKTDDSIEYNILINESENTTTIENSTNYAKNLKLKISGLNGMSQVTENFIMSENDMEINYLNNVQFQNIVQEDVTVDQMLFLNTAPSAENVEKLLSQIVERLEQLNITYYEKTGINYSLLAYYYNAIDSASDASLKALESDMEYDMQMDTNSDFNNQNDVQTNRDLNLNNQNDIQTYTDYNLDDQINVQPDIVN